MEFYGIILFGFPLLAYILRTIGQRGRHFYIARIILLSIALVIAVLFVIDYVSCLMAFAARSPIFDIEYSYEPHDVLIGAAFADLVLCSIFIPRDIIHFIAWRKRKIKRHEENKRQAQAVGYIKVERSRGVEVAKSNKIK